jgi:Kef-type K+ transport system membrane component KefB
MLESFPAAAELAWPIVIALAWLAGELGHRWSIPRISTYGMIGFALAPAQLGLLQPPANGIDGTGMLLANVAFGLILFEFGYRINVRWLRTNPWLGATGLLESAVTFAAVYFAVRLMGVSMLSGLLLASLSMATSPASAMRVINEQRGSGQVTERILHLAAINCVLAVFTFNVIVGFWTFDTSGNLWQAVSKSLLVLAVSAGLGAAFGNMVPGLLRRTGRLDQDATVAFAIAVIMLVGVTHAFKFSPLLATLTFGLVARHRRMTLDQTQRNFGALGDLLSVVLFVYIATTLDWSRVMSGAGVAMVLLGVRLAAKVISVALLAHHSGTTVRKGVLTGVGLMPISVFVILLLENTRYLGIDLIDYLAPLAAATLALEVLGPIATQQALRLAGETRQPDKS